MDFLSLEELKEQKYDGVRDYCARLREYLIDNVMQSGGHLASNLGIVEISVALMRIFSPPNDKIIYDVGHQSYVHKLLTGRHFNADNLRREGGYSGFTRREESEYDCFGAGHSSTALSAAIGFAAAAKLKGENSFSVAVVGDGAFSGGMNLEALNNAGSVNRLIIILNDNEMSISKNVGGMAKYLNRIRTTDKYFKIKKKSRKILAHIPLVGKPAENAVVRFKGAMKRALLKTNFFEGFGVEYFGPADGNDIEVVERLLNEAKLHSGPVLIHLCTKKGKGYQPAEEKPESFHAVYPSKKSGESYTSHFSRSIVELAKKRDDVVTITAAMSSGVGLDLFKERFPHRFFDVGICEEHAMTFAAGLAAAGLLPVFSVYSTFFQRCYDQLLHDVSLQKLKCITVLANAGIVGEDGPTHHGLFDVSMVLNLPNVSVFSPATSDEITLSLERASELDGASVIRYPKGVCCNEDYLTLEREDMLSYTSVKKCDVLFITYGRIGAKVLAAANMLEGENISCGVLKYICIKPVDIERLEKFIAEYSPRLICFVEECMKTGGFSEHLLCDLVQRGRVNTKAKIIAVDGYVPFGRVDYLFDVCGLSPKKIADSVKGEISK